MKVFILLLFVFTLPIVVILTTILYGGFSTDMLKQELSKTGMYKQIGTYVTELSGDDSDPQSEQFIAVIKNRFTPMYLQEKTEEVIDVSSKWISNTTTTTPSISFREIKEDITSQYPDLIPQLEAYAQEGKAQAASSEMTVDEMENTAQMTEGINNLISLAKSDFTLDLTTYLAPLKGLYGFLTILLPVLGILLVLYLALLLWMNGNWKARLKWIGAALLLAAVWGFVVIFISGMLLQMTSQIMLSTTNPILLVVMPLYYTVVAFFNKMYMNYQGITSVVFFCIAAGCFIGVAMLNKQSPKVKSAKGK